MISILFTAFPYNLAKITMVCMPYTICLFSFLLATWMFFFGLQNKNEWVRQASSIFFFYSFFTNSILVLYLIIPGYILIDEYKSKKGVCKKRIFRNLTFLLLPIIFGILRSKFFTPQNYYKDQGYNEIKFNYLIGLPKKIIEAIQENIFGIFKIAINDSYFWIFITIAVTILIIQFLRRKKIKYNVNRDQNWILQLVLGLTLFVLAVIPYILVGKSPLFADYSTRNQVLIGFGVAIIFYSLVQVFIQDRIRNTILMIFVILLAFSNITLQFKQLNRWYIQESIIHSMSEKGEFNERVIYVKYYNQCRDAFFSNFRFYELNGMYKLLFRKENMIFIDDNFIDNKLTNSNLSEFVNYRRKVAALESLNMKDFQPDGTCLTMKIESFSTNNYLELIDALFKYYFKNEEFKKDLKKFAYVTFLNDCPSKVQSKNK
jgi:hypothetical protein